MQCGHVRSAIHEQHLLVCMKTKALLIAWLAFFRGGLPVGDEVQVAAKFLVVVCQPLEQGRPVHNF